MNTLSDLITKKKLRINQSNRRINPLWEEAKEFGDYVGIPTVMVLRLFKIYGRSNVLNLRSWLYDLPHDPKKGKKFQLAIWKLKQNDKTYIGGKEQPLKQISQPR